MEPVNDIFLTIGVDLGQRRDPTAIAVLELTDRSRDRGAPSFDYETRHLERLPLGTKYPAVAERVAEVERNARQAARQAHFQRTGSIPEDVFLETFLDATGAVPALDLFRERGIYCRPCFFNYGDRRTENGDEITIGKAWLVNRLQALVRSDRLHLPPGHAEAAAMMRELQDYEIRVTPDAHDTYGAFRVGSHDDLVTALGLAAQWAPPAHYGWEREVHRRFVKEYYG
jgi:hypothetical protein